MGAIVCENARVLLLGLARAACWYECIYDRMHGYFLLKLPYIFTIFACVCFWSILWLIKDLKGAHARLVARPTFQAHSKHIPSNFHVCKPLTHLVNQNYILYIYMVYTVFWQGNHQIYGHIWCTYVQYWQTPNVREVKDCAVAVHNLELFGLVC